MSRHNKSKQITLAACHSSRIPGLCTRAFEVIFTCNCRYVGWMWKHFKLRRDGFFFISFCLSRVEILQGLLVSFFLFRLFVSIFRSWFSSSSIYIFSGNSFPWFSRVYFERYFLLATVRLWHNLLYLFVIMFLFVFFWFDLKERNDLVQSSDN